MVRFFPDLRYRHLEQEEMDAPGLDPAEHARALRALGRIGILSWTAQRICREVVEYAKQVEGPVRILDVACGGGDVPLSIKRWGERKRLQVEVEACDLSPVALEVAKEKAENAGLDVRFFQHNATDRDLPGGFDIVASSLFLHHLSETEADLFLRALRGAGNRVLVQDLLRTRVGYALASATSRVITRSKIVHIDGPRSVRAAFSLPEVRAIARNAGMEDAHVAKCWPERFSLLWERRPEAVAA
ncbi:MAG: methyltransferase domain-containing protein [Gemmatimonadetes bacterium]|nr:methyltransferase domain-containing protein [Gemmatimonadota bacterium]NNM04591.1 methyltransferase domain-containing protein [Gemmatimonadota bacterium]